MVTTPRRLGPVAAGAALLGLLAVVAAASRTRLFHEGDPPVSASTSHLLLDFGSYLFISVLLLGCAVMAWALWPREGYDGPQPQRRSAWQVFVQTAAMVVVLGLLVWLVDARRSFFGSGAPGRAGAGAAAPPAAVTGVPDVPAAFDWTAAGLVALTLVVTAAVLWRAYGRRRRAVAERRAVARELADAVGESLDDLRLDVDPRRAVLHAYARMERILGLHGLSRRRSEAPREYLTRTLREAAQLSEPSLERLTGLFEEARFSRHDISPAMRAEAVEALVEVRRELSLAG